MPTFPPSTPTQIISGLIMGRAVDIYNRKMIIFYGIIIWSFATACIGVSNNFVQLLLSRILLGVAESSATAASISLIADYFPAESLGQVSHDNGHEIREGRMNPVAPVAHQVILEPGIGQFRESEPPGVPTRIYFRGTFSCT